MSEELLWFVNCDKVQGALPINEYLRVQKDPRVFLRLLIDLARIARTLAETKRIVPKNLANSLFVVNGAPVVCGASSVTSKDQNLDALRELAKITNSVIKKTKSEYLHPIKYHDRENSIENFNLVGNIALELFKVYPST